MLLMGDGGISQTKSWRERGKEANGDEPARPSSPPRAFSGPPSRVGSNVSLAGMGVGEGAAAEMSSPSRANGSASSLSALSPNAYSNRGSAKDLRNRYVDVSGEAPSHMSMFVSLRSHQPKAWLLYRSWEEGRTGQPCR
jgi:hypothetical protein